MQTRFASAERLQAALNIDPERAERLRALVKGKVKPEMTAHPSGNRYANLIDAIMQSANALLHGYGVEAIQGDWVDGFWGSTIALYVNTGDTYRPTLLYDVYADRFALTSWGDWYEKQPQTEGS